MNDLKKDKRILFRRSIIPFGFTALLVLIKIIEVYYKKDFSDFGIYPLEKSGLKGIIFAPLIHSSWKHLFNNSLPVFFLGWALFYFYRVIALRVFILIYFIHGFWLWFLGREAYHIGASGLVYGLSSFLFFSGMLRKNSNLLAISLLVSFMYGSLIWGIFPIKLNMSWEGHLTGLVAGFVFSIYYKDLGPSANMGKWKYRQDKMDKPIDPLEEIPDDENAFWNNVELSDEDKKLLE